MQRTSRTSFARRFVKKRCLSVPLYKIHYKKTERNDVPKTNKSTIASLYRTLNCTTSAFASPADIELCQQPLIPLQKFIFTLQIPTLGDPLYLSGHQTLDGKIILSEKQTTMLQEQWRCIALFRYKILTYLFTVFYSTSTYSFDFGVSVFSGTHHVLFHSLQLTLQACNFFQRYLLQFTFRY